MTISREIQLVERPTGAPGHEHFRLAEVEVAPLQEGELLVKNEWMSVDPAMRGRMRDVPSYIPPFQLGRAMEGGAVGTVVASRSAGIPEGARVVHMGGWRDYAVLDERHARVIDADRETGADHLGVLGLTGLTAYVGLKEVAAVAPGDVVFVSGAAGAVGSVAPRIAKHLGASSVVGSAGGHAKRALLVDEFGYDIGLDYTAAPIRESLHEAVPDGIDVYFDNVGGDHLEAALAALRVQGRIALCGSIASYNADRPVPGPSNLVQAVTKRLTLRGFIARDWPQARDEWIDLATGWLADGSLVSAKSVAEGLDTAVDALLGLFTGANVGKMLVRLGGDA